MDKKDLKLKLCMEQKIKVSIILPVYNVGVFFEECLNSVLCQEYQNIEIILIDDGSTDNSGEIADKYAELDNRIKVIHQTNSGVSTARNVGIENATGEYICFSDPDDILRPDYVEYMLELCLKYDVEVAVCAEVFTSFMQRQPNEKLRVITGEEAAAEILYGQITVGCYSKLFKRSFLNNNHIRFFPDVSIGEGFNFNVLAFCSAKKVAISQHKIYYYRLDNANSAMTKFSIQKCEMGINAIQIIRKKLKIKNKKMFSAVDFAEYTTIGSMFDWMVLAGATHEYPMYYKLWRKRIRILSWKALFAPTTRKIKLSALIRIFSPYIWAYLRKTARKQKNPQ